MGYRVAVVGATGAVGAEMLNILAERDFPADEVVALASSASLGKEVSYGDKDELKVKVLDDFDFEGFDVALFSPGASVSKIHAPRAAGAGCTVIDNTSHFRMDPDVPLIVPEVNREALEGFRERNIIANPNCSTIEMVVALKPLHDTSRIKRVVVSTYQSASGAGKAGMDELFDQTKGIYETRQVEPKTFQKTPGLQRHPADRCFPRGWLDQGRVEDGGRDQEDPRSGDRGDRYLRALPDLRRPCGRQSTSSSSTNSPSKRLAMLSMKHQAFS